ncbi:centromere protein C [Sorex fumeus]|uniref:centromere protein C n=1 Tax=Sorex fumeus TaxID=62283 RepID=UPI0024AD1F26|nr:centromere protein C [Sorex fumeus]
MAASGLDHLKNDYRRRFCRPSRVLDIDTENGRNILDILQNCFEENSFVNELSANSIASVLHSKSEVENICISPRNKEAGITRTPGSVVKGRNVLKAKSTNVNQESALKSQCQKSPPKSVSVSSKNKNATLQLTEGIVNADNSSGQTQDVCEKILATNVGSKHNHDSRRMSKRNRKDHHDEDKEKEEFYLSVGSPSVILNIKTSALKNAHVSIDQKREAYTFENSVNKLSSSTAFLKTKKRLNFEDKDVSEKKEMENIVSEGPRQRTLSGKSQKTVQKLEDESQPQTTKSFSALFLETVRKTGKASPVNCVVNAPPHSTPENDMKLLEDEFLIDESDRSFACQSWITIPRKTEPQKQCTVSPAEGTVAFSHSKRTREKQPRSATLPHDSPAKAHPRDKSQPSEPKKLGRNHALTDEMENNYRSEKSEMYSEDANKVSERKRTQNQRSSFKTSIVEQVDMKQTEDKSKNRSNITQDKLKRKSNINVEESENMSSDHISPKQMQPVGSKKSKTSVPFSKNKKKERKDKAKREHSSNRSKLNKLAPEKDSFTLTRSRRVSRQPSDWWVVKSEQNLDVGSSPVNELPVQHNTRQKPGNKAEDSSRSVGKKSIPHKRLKKDTLRSSRPQKVLDAKDSGKISHHDEISNCSQKSLESKDLAEEKNFQHAESESSSEDQARSIAIQSVYLPSQTSECMAPSESDSDSGEPQTSVLQESGPSRIKNHVMSAKNDSDVDDKEAFESSDDSKVKGFKEVSENKIQHKLVLPTNTPNVRRTKRVRLKPLEYWRGERVDYRVRPSGGFVVGGILSPDAVPSKRKTKENTGKVNKKDNRKRICLDDDERIQKLIENLAIQLGDPLQPTMIKDPETKESILLDLIRQRDSYQFLVQHGELKVYKTLDTPFFSTGKLVLGPNQEKGKQHVGSDILVFYVNFGDLLCTLHETPYIITTGDSFYVPSGNYYNIRNLLNEESVLLFTQIKR